MVDYDSGGINQCKISGDLIQDHITWMEEQHKALGYIESVITAIKSWLSHFEIEIKRMIKINGTDSTHTLEDEKVPEAKEISESFGLDTRETWK